MCGLFPLAFFSLNRGLLKPLFGTLRLPALLLCFKIIIMWDKNGLTSALQYCDSQSDPWGLYWKINVFIVCALNGFAGQRHRSYSRQMAPEVMHHGTPLQMSHFWSFPFAVFRTQLTLGNRCCWKQNLKWWVCYKPHLRHMEVMCVLVGWGHSSPLKGCPTAELWWLGCAKGHHHMLRPAPGGH